MEAPTRLQIDDASPGTRTTFTSRLGVRRLSVRHFLFAMILLMVTVPYVEEVPFGDLIESVLMTLVMLTAVMAVGARRKALIVAVILVIPAVLGKWIQHFQHDFIHKSFVYLTAIVFLVYVIGHLIFFILRAPRVNDVLCAALSVYLLLGLLWALGYLLLSCLDPRSLVLAGEARALSSADGLFVSFGTLSTVGYDEVKAASRLARMLAMAEAMTGTFYIALLIARLVAIYSGDVEPQVVNTDEN